MDKQSPQVLSASTLKSLIEQDSGQRLLATLLFDTGLFDYEYRSGEPMQWHAARKALGSKWLAIFSAASPAGTASILQHVFTLADQAARTSQRATQS